MLLIVGPWIPANSFFLFGVGDVCCWCFILLLTHIHTLSRWFLKLNSYNYLVSICLVLDTAAGVWCDTKSVVTSPRTGRYSADAAGGDASVELTRRCRHAAAAVGDLIFIYGGLRGGKIIDCYGSCTFGCI